MSKQKAKTYNYEFQASETVHYIVDIEASSFEEAREKLHNMDSQELMECVGDTSNWYDELSYTDEPEEEATEDY